MSKKTKDAGATPEGGEEQSGGRSKKKLLVMVLVPLLLVGGAGYWFFLKPSGGNEAPVAGEVVPLEAIQVNLQSGHYLRVGLALQLVEGAAAVDGSQALDATIDLFSGLKVDEIVQPKERNQLKTQLEAQLEDRYDGAVMGVYFTDFVTQ